ncbi:MAG: VanZ family protein [Candidatus Omnitrophota bacterium]
MQKITHLSLKLKVFSWVYTIAYATFIFYLSDQPSIPSIIELPLLDKFLHTIEYAIFGFLLMRAFKNSGFNLDSKTIFSFSVILGFVYGISDEIHQAFVLNRTASIIDALFDLIGASLGAYFLYDTYKTI